MWPCPANHDDKFPASFPRRRCEDQEDRVIVSVYFIYKLKEVVYQNIVLSQLSPYPSFNLQKKNNKTKKSKATKINLLQNKNCFSVKSAKLLPV